MKNPGYIHAQYNMIDFLRFIQQTASDEPENALQTEEEEILQTDDGDTLTTDDE